MSHRAAAAVPAVALLVLVAGCSRTTDVEPPAAGRIPAEELPAAARGAQRTDNVPAAQDNRAATNPTASSQQSQEAATQHPTTQLSTAQRPTTVKVAAIQCSSVLGAVEDNRRKLIALVREAAGEGAKIIVLPEAAITGYLSQDLATNWQRAGWPIEPAFQGKDPLPFAETVPGPSTQRFCQLSKELQVYVTIPLVERSDENGQDKQAEPKISRLFNTVCLASPQGELVAHYRKLSPWPYPEQSWATPGDRGIQIYDSEYGRMGLAICFDVHTILEKYESHKLWALLYPIAWVDANHPAEWFWHMLPARVAPFKHYCIGANWSVDEPQEWRGYGFSTIIGPQGKVLASAKSLHGSEIVYATIKTAWAKE